MKTEERLPASASERGPYHDEGGEAVIEHAEGYAYITIRVPVNALPTIVEHMQCEYQEGPPFKVADPTAFARSLIRTLNEPGATEGPQRIHEFFDQAIHDCWEMGDAEGVEELGDDDDINHVCSSDHCHCIEGDADECGCIDGGTGSCEDCDAPLDAIDINTGEKR